MRYYGFGNYYLSQIQQGIQAAHVITEMSVNTDSERYCDYVEWAKNHKTMVLLNGGNAASLKELISFLSLNDALHLHWDFFNEDDQSLNGALTAVGVIVPEDIYLFDFDKYPDYNTYLLESTSGCYELTEPQFLFGQMLRNYKLA